MGPPLTGHFMVYNQKQQFYITLDQHYYNIGVKGCWTSRQKNKYNKPPKGFIITYSKEDKLQSLDLG